MTIHELRDSDDARRFLLQGLCLQRVRPPRASTVRPVLEWALEIVSGGEPLPPIGFVADVGHLAFGLEPESKRQHEASLGLSAGLARAYEDQVLGKLYADSSFERAADALRRYQGRDRAKGLAFVLNQIRQRAGLGGVMLAPGAIKAMFDLSPEEVLARGWESLGRDGPLPIFTGWYQQATVAVRNLADVLGPEDVFELEHGTAVAAFSQRVALRQVLQAVARFESELPRQKPRSVARRHEVATRIHDEDTYPVGGFASVSTRGTVESLLHSQLAYMETAAADRPDLFDVKYLRDELLYYSRDENQFLRRRRTYVFALYPDLAQARFKDAELPWQRIVLLLAILVTAVRKLIDWLSTEALLFEFIVVEANDKDLLAPERGLLEMLLREQVANGTVRMARLPEPRLGPHCAERARRSLCHCLVVSAEGRRMEPENVAVTSLRIDSRQPKLGSGTRPAEPEEGENGLTEWTRCLSALLMEWA